MINGQHLNGIIILNIYNIKKILHIIKINIMINLSNNNNNKIWINNKKQYFKIIINTINFKLANPLLKIIQLKSTKNAKNA